MPFQLGIEVSCSVLMLLGLFLLTLQNRAGFFCLAIQNLLLLAIAIKGHAFILCVLQLLFFVMNLEGFILWHQQKIKDSAYRILSYTLITLLGCGTIFVLDRESHSLLGGIQLFQLLFSIIGQYLLNKQKNGFMLWVIASIMMLIICYDKQWILLFMATTVGLALNVKGAIQFNLRKIQRG